MWFVLFSSEDRMLPERFNDIRLQSRLLAKDEVLDWPTFYSSKWIHLTLGYMSPMAFQRKRLAEESKLIA